jgi:uncharacterized membrane protein
MAGVDESAASPQHGARHPAWRRQTQGERRWPASLAVLAAVALQLALPARLTMPPRYVLPAIEIVLVVGLSLADPDRIDTRDNRLRLMGIVIIAVLSLANMGAGVRLVSALVQGHGPAESAARLLVNGGSVYVTNVIAFGLWYWELDRGGPAARAYGLRPYPDFLFPQMASPEVSPPDWEPFFVDYLYLSFTNATAFSPTDVMPLTRWAKATMALQSAVALVVVVLVIARAINILGS